MSGRRREPRNGEGISRFSPEKNITSRRILARTHARIPRRDRGSITSGPWRCWREHFGDWRRNIARQLRSGLGRSSVVCSTRNPPGGLRHGGGRTRPAWFVSRFVDRRGNGPRGTPRDRRAGSWGNLRIFRSLGHFGSSMTSSCSPRSHEAVRRWCGAHDRPAWTASSR